VQKRPKPIYSNGALRQDNRPKEGDPMATREFQRPDLDPSQDPLWHRIEAFDLDTLDPTDPFSLILARENGWTSDYAARVVEEYKRFCYLAVKAGRSVIPSGQIDRAWQLHLSYSRNYWESYCAKVLCADLHHDPVRNSDTEDADRHRETYAATRQAYERLSGEQPPRDIWPVAELLFADSESLRRVNTKDHMIVPRPPKGLLWVAQTVLILATLYFLWHAEYVTGFIVGAAAAAIAVFRDSTDNEWITKPWRDGDDDGTSSGGGSMRGI
jgi:hypothetical protein